MRLWALFLVFGLINTIWAGTANKLIKAIQAGEVKRARGIIEGGVNPDSIISGESILMCAAVHGHVEIVDLLLDKGADVAYATPKGKTALLSAISNGRYAALVRLVDHGADIEREDEDGWTPLFYAVDRGDPAIVMLLAHKGADVKHQSSKGRTVLHVAAAKGDRAMAAYLLDLGLDLDSLDKDGFSPLSYAVKWNHFPVAQLLIRHGADTQLDIGKGKSLASLVPTWNKAMSDLLSDPPPLVGEGPGLYTAPFELSFVKSMVENGGDVNRVGKMGETPLFHAVQRGTPEVTAYLLENGADPDIADNLGVTPLMIAVSLGRTEQVKTLLRHGVDVDALAERKFSALYLAGIFQEEVMARLLIEGGATTVASLEDGVIALGRGSFVKGFKQLKEYMSWLPNLAWSTFNSARGRVVSYKYAHVVNASDPGIEPPVATKMVKPEYPKNALRRRLEGGVTLEVIVGSDGKLKDVVVLKTLGNGKLGFEKQAIRAIKHFKFKPGTLNGEPVDVRTAYTILFTIRR